jgi:hypothetical protein
MDWITGILRGIAAPLGSWIAVASAGALAAWLLTYVREKWNRPRLSLAIDGRGGSLVAAETMGKDQTIYARLIVRNRGRTLAKNCCAAIDYIKRIDPGSHYEFATDLIDLKWSLLEKPVTFFNVPSGGYRLVDVGHTHISASDFASQKLNYSMFWIDGAILPNRLIPELKMNAAYEMHIRAYADNATPVEFSCRITVGTTFRDISLVPCGDPRPKELKEQRN